MIKTLARKVLTRIRRAQVPGYLKKNHIQLDAAELKKIEISIRENYHRGWRSEQNYHPEVYAKDLKAHLDGRLDSGRYGYIPWINKTVPLKGANILEIGCGSGSSTIALAEQGARVTGIDLDEDALVVARERCAIYKVDVNIMSGNAIELYEDLKDQKFDLIIFYACMEHMIYSERIESLKKYYDLLPKGGYLCIIETPNRLWYFDNHTSFLPFFNWLPDRVAYDYSKFSSRKNFKELYHKYSEENFLDFLRRGRGFSFHEFEIALNIPVEKYQVASYIRPNFIPFTFKSKYHHLLTRMYPKVSKGFFCPNVDIIIKK